MAHLQDDARDELRALAASSNYPPIAPSGSAVVPRSPISADPGIEAGFLAWRLWIDTATPDAAAALGRLLRSLGATT